MIRYGWRVLFRLSLVWLGVIVAVAHGGRGDTIPPELAADANLNDVFFIDGKVGWAVGDRGVIWHTVTGGKNWNRQPFPTSDRLTTVCFHDVQNGWIGTSWIQPYLHASRGQIWRTDNGGKSWRPSKSDTLPAVRTLFFVDARQGWATTEQSMLHDSSLFQSHDGGRSWNAVHGTGSGDPRTAIRSSSSNGIGPGGLADEFAWLAMERQGSNVWIAGDPGTAVFRSSDDGQSWSASLTEQALPIRQLRFIDARRGWAVGAQGTILVTSDGGVRWQPQRMVVNRVAVLGIYSQATDIDWELLTQLSVQEGHRSHVLLVDEEARPGGNADNRIEARAHEAAVIAGSGGVTYLDLSRGDDTAFTRRLVRALRTWQPDVVVTAGDSPGAKRLHAAIVKAIEQAAESTAFPTQLSLADLRAWQVRKAFLRETNTAPGALRGNGPVVAAAQLVLPLGQSLADVGASCRARITTGYDPPPSIVSYRSLLPGGNGRQIMSGAISRRGGASRRPASNTTVGNIRELSVLAQRRRMAELLLTKYVEGGRDIAVLLGQLDRLISGVGQPPDNGQRGAGRGQISAAEREAAGDTVFRLGEMLAAHDRQDAADALRQLFLDRFDEHPARDAVVWRQLQAATSAELRLWHGRRSKPAQSPPQNQARRGSPDPAEDADRRSSAAWGDLRSHEWLGQETGHSRVDRHDGNNMDIQQLFKAASPLLASRPEVRWALAMAARKNVGLHIARQTTIDSEWQRRAAATAWLTKRTAKIPTILWKCPRGPTPRLDGELDDETWQDVPRVLLHSLRPNGEKPTDSLAAAYDTRFFYLGITCPKAAGVAYPASQQSRQRDTDLSAFDRVELSIDTNQDAMSAWQLTIDSRGWANDACLGHESWNPTWHITVNPAASSWTVEAAIPLGELTAQAITTGEAWAVAVRRHTPGNGTKAWPATVHATAEPQSFGLLLFE